MDFGGAYGFTNGGTKVNNPVTNAQSCPDGYTKEQIYGTYNEDWPVYLCYRKRSLLTSDEPPKLEFGGMWGYVGGVGTRNPLTGSSSCPTDYEDLELLGTYNQDWSLHVCWRNYSPYSAKPLMKFGGVLGTKEKQAVPNQVSSVGNCPRGYTSQKVLGMYNQDWPFSYCYALEPGSTGIDKSTYDPKVIAAQFAPKIWLESDEKFFPAEFESYAPFVHMVCNGTVVADNILQLQYSIFPANQEGCYIQTRAPLSGPYDYPAWTAGTRPTTGNPVPIYTDIYELDGDDPSMGTFVAQYNAFFPYNYGKNVCMSFAPSDNCLSKRHLMGNHVGDWELLTIRFINGVPNTIHIGAHGNDIPETASTFNAPMWTNDGRQPADNNLVLSFTMDPNGGRHPIVYSASKSHGMWSYAGKHNYKTTEVGDRWNDYTDQGFAWDTWEHVVFSDDSRYSSLLNVYAGRWGNPHLGLSACDLAIAGHTLCAAGTVPKDEYEMNDGPNRPIKRAAPFIW